MIQRTPNPFNPDDAPSDSLDQMILRLRDGIVLVASPAGGIGGTQIDRDLKATKLLMMEAADAIERRASVAPVPTYPQQGWTVDWDLLCALSLQVCDEDHGHCSPESVEGVILELAKRGHLLLAKPPTTP